MLQKIKKKNLYEEIARQIMKLISEGHFKPGQQIPGERELAAELGVNRGSLREALRVLEMMRIVEKRIGDGVYVRDTIRDASLEALVFRFLAEDGLDRDSLEGVSEAIVIVESNMARLAAARAQKDDLDRLRLLIVEMELHIDNPGRFTELDRNFHLLIGELGKSPVLYSVAYTMWIIMSRYADALHREPERRARCLNGHHLIAAALAAGDGENACREMERHLKGAVRALVTGTSAPAPAVNV